MTLSCFFSLFAQLLIARKGSLRVQAQHLPQLAWASSRLQIAYGKGIAQHGGADLLFGDPGALAESAKEQRDRIGVSG